MIAGRNHIALLDGMRGIAAILVVLGHARLLPGNSNSLPVDFFFMLSGYVVALAYETRFEAGISFAAFAKVRLIRLYPTIFMGSLLLLGVALMGFNVIHGDLPLVIFMQFAILPLLAPGLDVFRINGIQWSLFFELFANAMHHLLFRWLSIPLLLAICGISLVGLIAASVIHTTFTVGWWGDNFWVGFPRVCFPYFAGVLIFRVTRERRLPSTSGGVMLAVFAAVAFVPNIPGVPVNGLRLAVLTVVFPVIIVLSLKAKLSQTTSSLTLLLGELSYPLYATHLAVVLPALHFTSELGGVERSAWMLAAVLVSLVLAFGVSRMWDRPVRSWINRALQKTSPAAA